MNIHLMHAEEIEQMFHAFSGEPYNKTLSIFQEYFHEQQNGQQREVYIASSEGNIVGYITLVWHSPYPPFAEQQIPEIKDLNILVAYRRKGYAKKLIHHCEQRVRTAGFATIGIGAGITPDYNPARHLYASLGYISDDRGIHPDEWGGATYFTKTLSKK